MQSTEENNVQLAEMVEIKKEAVSNLQNKVVDKIREKQVWSTTHAFALLHLHDDNSKRPYYVIRCQGRRMGGSINKLRRKHPQAEVLYQQKKVPNAVNLYSRLKQQKIVQHTHNYCTPTCNQKELLIHLNSLCGTSYPSSNIAPLNN